MNYRIYTNKNKSKTVARILLVFGIGLSVFIFSGCNNNKFSQVSKYEKANNNSISILVKERSITSEGLTIVLTNNTKSDIFYDSTFIIEEKRNGKWYKKDKNQYFDALGIILKANSSSEFEIKLDEKLSKGNYRIIKPFFISSKTFEFDVEFSYTYGGS